MFRQRIEDRQTVREQMSSVKRPRMKIEERFSILFPRRPVRLVCVGRRRKLSDQPARTAVAVGFSYRTSA